MRDARQGLGRVRRCSTGTAPTPTARTRWTQCRAVSSVSGPALAPLWAELAGICAVDCSAVENPEPAWGANMLDGALPDGVTLSGNAYLDGAMGIALDGLGDYVVLDQVPDYAADGDFSVSMWFTRSSECHSDSDWEFLWSQTADENGIPQRTKLAWP